MPFFSSLCWEKLQHNQVWRVRGEYLGQILAHPRFPVEGDAEIQRWVEVAKQTGYGNILDVHQKSI